DPGSPEEGGRLVTGLLVLAFAAGMSAPVNPCGFALLPAWITYALGDADTSPLPVRLGQALRSGAALTLGFAGTLAAAGLIVRAGARALTQAAPWLGLATGIALLLFGLATFVPRARGGRPAAAVKVRPEFVKAMDFARAIKKAVPAPAGDLHGAR